MMASNFGQKMIVSSKALKFIELILFLEREGGH